MPAKKRKQTAAEKRLERKLANQSSKMMEVRSIASILRSEIHKADVSNKYLKPAYIVQRLTEIIERGKTS